VKSARSEVRNITLALPATLLRKVKRLAVERESSVSRLLTETLERIVGEGDEYERARRRFLERLKKGFDLETKGRVGWTRDELHDR
jgi:hypothetical protein